jgi:hypothetical protein
MLEDAASTFSRRLTNALKEEEEINADFPYLSEFMRAEIDHMCRLTHDVRKLSAAKSTTDAAFHLESKL